MEPGNDPHQVDVDAELYERARRVAAARGIDLDAYLQRMLERFADDDQ